MDDDLIWAALPFVVIVVMGVGFWFAIRERPGRARHGRWTRRDRQMDPKTNGHTRRGPRV
jgi:choline-glycine betaine transporter